MHKRAKVWLLFLFICTSCGNTLQNQFPPSPGDLQKISIIPNQVYDLSGYADEGGGNPGKDQNLVPEYDFVLVLEAVIEAPVPGVEQDL